MHLGTSSTAEVHLSMNPADYHRPLASEMSRYQEGMRHRQDDKQSSNTKAIQLRVIKIYSKVLAKVPSYTLGWKVA